MIKIYGISNCDTVRKARKFLDKQGLEYVFIDFKKQPPTKTLIQSWLKYWPWQELVNRKGTTWRKLPETVKAEMTQAQAINLMREQPSVIKRPILNQGQQYLLGFDEQAYSELN